MEITSYNKRHNYLEDMAATYSRLTKRPFTLPTPCISESCIEIKINLNFYFTLLCGASKGFMKVPFEVPQIIVKKEI